MKTYMHIQVAYPIIMKQNWRGVAEAQGGGGTFVFAHARSRLSHAATHISFCI